jgi:enolase-phosphatase E1
MADFLARNAQQPEVAEQLAAIAADVGKPLDIAAANAVLQGWMAEDRKATSLKALQGMIWAQGYAAGELQGHVYADTPVALKAWQAQGLKLYVYSSGSVPAQKLIFRHTAYGDLTPLFTGYFDTRIGAKREAQSYQRIADELALPPEQILFLSDIGEELDAACAAGMQTAQLLRDAKAKPFAAHAGYTAFADIPFSQFA